jgi:HEAT repeat protein
MLGLAFITGGEINAQIAAAAREHGIKDAPMIGLEAAPPKPGEPQPAPRPGEEVARLDADPVRKLIVAAREEQGQAKAALAAALGAYGPAAEVAVPDLTAMLEDEHPAVRAEAVAALGRVGAPASSAVPKLRKLVEGDDPALREGAARAVAAIEAACNRPAVS